MKITREGIIVTAMLFALFLVVFFGFIWLWMWAWNAVVPSIFNGPTITFWQAFALSVLVSLIGNAFKAAAGKKE